MQVQPWANAMVIESEAIWNIFWEHVVNTLKLAQNLVGTYWEHQKLVKKKKQNPNLPHSQVYILIVPKLLGTN
jgi:hypothetical protein